MLLCGVAGSKYAQKARKRRLPDLSEAHGKRRKRTARALLIYELCQNRSNSHMSPYWMLIHHYPLPEKSRQFPPACENGERDYMVNETEKLKTDALLFNQAFINLKRKLRTRKEVLLTRNFVEMEWEINHGLSEWTFSKYALLYCRGTQWGERLPKRLGWLTMHFVLFSRVNFRVLPTLTKKISLFQIILLPYSFCCSQWTRFKPSAFLFCQNAFCTF